MGEAKRRKQKLGAEYGQPLGLTASVRRCLIKDNLEQLLSQHYQACGYTDLLNNMETQLMINLKGSLLEIFMYYESFYIGFI